MASIGNYHFHVWELHPQTKRMFKYVGFFDAAESALAWCKKQERGKEGYKVTNFGPTDLVKHHTQKAEDKQRAADRREAVIAKSSRDAHLRKEARDAALARQQQRIEEERKKREERERLSAERMKERSEIAAGAEEIIRQHRDDEQSDLEQGINR